MLETRLRQLLTEARTLARGRGLHAEFSLHREHSSLMRLGNSAVALSTTESLARLDISVTDGRRQGSYSLNADIVAAAQLTDALERAAAYCAASPEKDYVPIFGCVEEPVDDDGGYDAPLAEFAPEHKAELCAQVVEAYRRQGDYDFSGSWSSGAAEFYYTSTANDREAWRRLTDGRWFMVLKDRARKWELAAELSGKAAAGFAAAGMVAQFAKLLPLYESQAPWRPSPGHYRVVFGPTAIAELVQLCTWAGFWGRGFEEKRAFTSGKPFGARLFSDQVSLVDDPAVATVYGMPFDLSGRRRRRFVLCENGLFRGVMYDSGTAAKYGRPPTGHDLGNTDLAFAAGNGPAGLEAALALAGEALYIPHLHYIHLPNPSEGQFTGSSRFNALRVVGGRLAAPICSSRITDTLVNVLGHVVSIGPRTQLVDVSSTYGRRQPTAVSVPEYLVCDNVRISDAAESF